MQKMYCADNIFLMPYSKEQLQEIRKKMIKLEGYAFNSSRREMCIANLIKFATDTEIPGFEDPKSKADDILRQLTGATVGRVSCWREDCDYVATYNTGKLEATKQSGKCALEENCTKQAFLENPDMLDATSIVVRRQEQIGFFCVRSECSYQCGYSIDGGEGNIGDCARGVVPEKEQPRQ